MKPRYAVIAAATIDGKIALHPRHFTSWTSKEDKTFLHSILDRSDVVVVGRTTFEVAKKPLSKRNCVVLTHRTQAKRGNEKLVYVNPQKTNVRSYLKKYRRIAILGGAQTYAYFLKKNLIDDIYLTIEPLVFGRGIPIFEGVSGVPKQFRLISSKKLNARGSLLLHYVKR